MPHPEDDNWSTASIDSLGSIDDLEPQTFNFSDGNFRKINTDLFNILHYNVNSILNKMDQIESRGRELNADIICLREVFKKLRRENLRPKNATPSDPPHPPPVASFFATPKITPIFFVGKCIYNGQNKFYAWSHVEIF